MIALAASQPASTTPLWLETQHESYLALYQPANRPQPRGGVLLLPHDRTSPDWPGAMQTLRRGLPDKGWHTLAIALPDEPLPLLPRFESASDAATSNEESPLQDHYLRISQRIETALAALRERGATKIYLIGEGSGGYWTNRYVSEHLGEQLYPILIDASEPNTAVQPLHQLTDALSMPALDLYHGDGLGQTAAARAAKLRADAARRAGHSSYFSVRMPPQADDWRQTDPRLLSLISGMIDKRLEAASQPQPQPEPEPARGQQRPGRRG